jgi:NADPH2:quinone reductase
VPFIVKKQPLLRAAIGELLSAVAAGELEVVIGGVYPLSKAAEAHDDISERRSTGKLLLDPTS